MKTYETSDYKSYEMEIQLEGGEVESFTRDELLGYLKVSANLVLEEFIKKLEDDGFIPEGKIDAYVSLLPKQTDIEPEFQRVLDENIWELYEK